MRLDAPQGDLFGGSMARLEPSLVREVAPEPEWTSLAEKLPKGVRLGTSSWAFPGWAGLVYDREAPSGALSRRGLEPYSRHPLLGCVGVDRTFYSPIPARQFEEYASLVPDGFRFVVKAERTLTFPRFTRPNDPGASFHENPDFLNPQRARDMVVGPTVAGLGQALGTILFQFPPLSPRAVGSPSLFAERLGRFLEALPAGVPYTVELRTPELITADVCAAISGAGASLARAVHPSLPPIREQFGAPAESATAGRAPLLIRWMLGHGRGYEEAKDRYAPFNRLVDPDPTSRKAIASACIDWAMAGHEVFVVVNNKAEGSSPLSVVALARELAKQAAGS